LKTEPSDDISRQSWILRRPAGCRNSLQLGGHCLGRRVQGSRRPTNAGKRAYVTAHVSFTSSPTVVGGISRGLKSGGARVAPPGKPRTPWVDQVSGPPGLIALCGQCRPGVNEGSGTGQHGKSGRSKTAVRRFAGNARRRSSTNFPNTNGDRLGCRLQRTVSNVVSAQTQPAGAFKVTGRLTWVAVSNGRGPGSGSPPEPLGPHLPSTGFHILPPTFPTGGFSL